MLLFPLLLYGVSEGWLELVAVSTGCTGVDRTDDILLWYEDTSLFMLETSELIAGGATYGGIGTWVVTGEAGVEDDAGGWYGATGVVVGELGCAGGGTTAEVVVHHEGVVTTVQVTVTVAAVLSESRAWRNVSRLAKEASSPVSQRGSSLCSITASSFAGLAARDLGQWL